MHYFRNPRGHSNARRNSPSSPASKSSDTRLKPKRINLGTLSPNPGDLSLLRQNVAERATFVAPHFRPLGRRFGRIHALP